MALTVIFDEICSFRRFDAPWARTIRSTKIQLISNNSIASMRFVLAMSIQCSAFRIDDSAHQEFSVTYDDDNGDQNRASNDHGDHDDDGDDAVTTTTCRGR